MNRGIARRTLFETADDIRFFLSRLARAVRRGDLEVHAYCILTTHFHILVRSPRGRLSAAMKIAQNEYVRRFNRTRRRDGPLVRGRFTSKPVLTETYHATLLRYIDHNPVAARLAEHPCEYPHGSAHHYARSSGPPWLERGWVEEHVKILRQRERYDPACYIEFARAPLDPARVRWIDARLAGKPSSPDVLDDLLAAAPAEVLAWMRRKARLADGGRVGMSLIDASVVVRAVEDRGEPGTWVFPARRAARDGWAIVRVALLRDLAARSFAEIARRTGCSESQARRMYRHHGALLDDPLYAERLAEITKSVLARGSTVP